MRPLEAFETVGEEYGLRVWPRNGCANTQFTIPAHLLNGAAFGLYTALIRSPWQDSELCILGDPVNAFIPSEHDQGIETVFVSPPPAPIWDNRRNPLDYKDSILMLPFGEAVMHRTESGFNRGYRGIEMKNWKTECRVRISAEEPDEFRELLEGVQAWLREPQIDYERIRLLFK